MKTTLLQLITAAALISFPKVNFSQILTTETTTGFIASPGSEMTFNTGSYKFNGSASGNSCSAGDFDEIAVVPTENVNTTVSNPDHCFADGQCYTAFTDNDNFEPRNYSPIVATLVYHQSTMDGRIPAKTSMSIILNGTSYTGNNGKEFDQIIQFELIYNESVNSESSAYGVSLQHKSSTYSILKGQQNEVKITDITWSADKTSFDLSLDFDCTMRSWGYNADGDKDVNLKGKLSNVHVTVPTWLAPKNIETSPMALALLTDAGK